MRLHQYFILSIYIVFFSCSLSVKAQNSPTSQFKDAPSDLIIPTEEQLFKDDPDPVVLSAQIAVRLKKIQKTISLDYNDHVQKYISYNTNPKRKEHVGKMLGRAEKFFPVFEPILAKYGVPDEMKYLAVIESALNPFALSRAGASGPWQFMYSTGLRYNLSISKRIDERRDPYLACDAAARYLKEMYNLYGSWQLAIASYNCGAGNVNRAIKKAGGSLNFWDIRPYLPAETRAYVPIYIAMVYAMKYADKYGMTSIPLENETTKRVTAKQKFTINDLEKYLGIPKQVIMDENPSLLTSYIPEDFILNLPASKITAFNELQDSLFNASQMPLIAKVTTENNSIAIETNNDNDTTKNNENSSTKPIVKNTTTTANKYKDEWKNIPSDEISKVEKKNAETSIKSSYSAVLKEDNTSYKTIAYTIKKGDNLGNIASWFHCNVKEIRRWNNLTGNDIKINDELLIYIHKNDYKKFVRFNYLSKNIKDDLSSKITTQEELNDATKAKKENEKTPIIDKINPIKILSKKDCFEKHKIKQGETLWTIAQKYDDVTVQDLLLWNGYKKTPILHKDDIIKVRKIKCK